MTELDPRQRDAAAGTGPEVSFRSARVGGRDAGHPLVAVGALVATLAAVVLITSLAQRGTVPPVAPSTAWMATDDGGRAATATIRPEIPVAGTVVDVVSGVVGPGLEGQRLYLAAGPVEHGAPAVPSYLVQHWGDLARGIDMDTTFAWVPVSIVVAGTEPATVACPASVASVLDIASLDPFERLVCFGGRTLVFGPTITSRLLMGSRTSDRWLTEDAHPDVHTAFPFYDIPGISADVPDHVWLRVSGHFDDPISASCGTAADVTWCRERFVVTAAVRAGSPFLAETRPSR